MHGIDTDQQRSSMTFCAQHNLPPLGLGRKNGQRIRNHRIEIGLLDVMIAPAFEQFPKLVDDSCSVTVGVRDVSRRFLQFIKFQPVGAEQAPHSFGIEGNRYQGLSEIVREGGR